MKLYHQMPWIKKEIKSSLSNLMSVTQSILSKVESKRHFYSAKFSCQLAVTEYDYSTGAGQQVIQAAASTTPSRIQPIQTKKLPVMINRKVSIAPGGKSVERSQTFAGRRSGVINGNQRPQIPIRRVADTPDSGTMSRSLQRKSYAGSEYVLTQGKKSRRLSVADAYAAQAPERVISKMNFGFTVDLSKSVSGKSCSASSASRSLHSLHSRSGENLFVNRDEMHELNDEDDLLMLSEEDKRRDEPPDVMETLKHLTEETSDNSHSRHSHSSSHHEVRHGEISALNIANRALNWERDHQITSCCPEKGLKGGSMPDASTFDQILEDASHQDPLIAFYYVDENNRVKMTEIFASTPDPDEENIENTQKLSSKW